MAKSGLSTKTNKAVTLDLNADLGEGGLYDNELLKLVTSANIACGAHAGDNQIMTATIQTAKHNQIRIGAHPSFPDRENFGRKPMNISPEKLYQSLYQQISLLADLCHQQAVTIDYIKPHGALYNLAAEDKPTANLIINLLLELKSKPLKGINTNLKLMMLADSSCCQWAKQAGIIVIDEAFADRRYTLSQSGKSILCPRAEQGAVITDIEQVLDQVRRLNAKQPIETVEGKPVTIQAESLCIHGDSEHALTFAKAIAKQLLSDAN